LETPILLQSTEHFILT